MPKKTAPQSAPAKAETAPAPAPAKRRASKPLPVVVEPAPAPTPAPAPVPAPKKKAPARKPKAAAPAPAPTAFVRSAPAATITAPAAEPAAPAAALTTVVAVLDVGFGNSLYLRGDGAGLSWNRGELMTCADGLRWVWQTSAATDPLAVKVLLNDQIWAEGENLAVTPGATVEFVPTF